MNVATIYQDRLDQLGIAAPQVVPSAEIAEFLIKSRLAYVIACFKNTTNSGLENHLLKNDENGQLLIKKQSDWVSLPKFLEEVVWDQQREKIVSRQDPAVVWSYRSPQGLVPIDPFHYGQLQPIEQLDSQQYREVMQEAEKFWHNHEEVDQGIQKPCVLQIITTKRENRNGWLVEQLNDALPQHATIHLIDAQGQLYSFGTQLEAGTGRALCMADLSDLFATTTAQFSTPDYEESRPFFEKTITSIPITSDRLNAMVKTISDANYSGVRFNALHQNCATLARLAVQMAGIQEEGCPRRITLYTYMGGLFPKLERIPGIGKPLQMVIEKIQSIAGFAFGKYEAITPQAIQIPIKQIGSIVTFIPRKIGALVCNVIMRLGGASNMKLPLPENVKDDLDNSKTFASFSSLHRSWWDLFNEDLLLFDSHTALIAWQKAQESTKVVSFKDKIKIAI